MMLTPLRPERTGGFLVSETVFAYEDASISIHASTQQKNFWPLTLVGFGAAWGASGWGPAPVGLASVCLVGAALGLLQVPKHLGIRLVDRRPEQVGQ
jgi:hypothetical protein